MVVDQQSRFSRGCNASELISDLVYYGGRFITADGIDTERPGWEELVGIKSIQSRMEIEDIGYRVRRQQEHLAEDPDGCVGDQPYGYSSEFRDPAAAAGYRGRGPKPRKRVIIDRPAAAVVRMVLIWFAMKGVSITKIFRRLNALGPKIPPIPSKTWRGWRYDHVHRILSQRKYIGDWTFGGTTTVRSGRGKKRQVPKKKEQRRVCTLRPHLRLIPQATWDVD